MLLVLQCTVMCQSQIVFFFQAEDGIRDLVRSRGLGDVYKRQAKEKADKEALEKMSKEEAAKKAAADKLEAERLAKEAAVKKAADEACLLYTSDAADERSSVDLGGSRIIKKKTKKNNKTIELQCETHARY